MGDVEGKFGKKDSVKESQDEMGLKSLIERFVVPMLNQGEMGVFDVVRMMAQSESLSSKERQLAQLLLMMVESGVVQDREVPLSLDELKAASDEQVEGIVAGSRTMLQRANPEIQALIGDESEAGGRRRLPNTQPLELLPRKSPNNGGAPLSFASDSWPQVGTQSQGSLARPQFSQRSRFSNSGDSRFSAPQGRRRVNVHDERLKRVNDTLEVKVSTGGLTEELEESLAMALRRRLMRFATKFFQKRSILAADLNDLYRVGNLPQSIDLNLKPGEDLTPFLGREFRVSVSLPYAQGREALKMHVEVRFARFVDGDSVGVNINWAA